MFDIIHFVLPFYIVSCLNVRFSWLGGRELIFLLSITHYFILRFLFGGVAIPLGTWICYLSRILGKPDFCICENKDADQLRGNREADQRLCFRYMDSTIPLLPKSDISSI